MGKRWVYQVEKGRYALDISPTRERPDDRLGRLLDFVGSAPEKDNIVA